MSRIGKLPVKVREGVQVTINGQQVTVKGKGSEQVVNVNPSIEVKEEEGEIILTRRDQEQQTRAYHGLYRALLNNAMVGVTDGFQKSLVLNGVGYRAQVKGKVLELNLGYSHAINYDIPEGIDVTVDKQTTVRVSGASREQVGQVAAKIRGFRPPEPFLGKGVRYEDENIRRKAGKSAGK